jgi:hypothetical protein
VISAWSSRSPLALPAFSCACPVLLCPDCKQAEPKGRAWRCPDPEKALRYCASSRSGLRGEKQLVGVPTSCDGAKAVVLGIVDLWFAWSGSHPYLLHKLERVPVVPAFCEFAVLNATSGCPAAHAPRASRSTTYYLASFGCPSGF